MSKRFGRNQRRRAREQIERLASMYNEQTRINHRQRTRIHELSDHIRYVAAVLGHMNVLAGERLQVMEGHDRMQVPIQEPIPSFADYERAGLDETEVACLEIMRLLDVEAVHDMAKRCVHAIVTLADKKAAYALSEATLRTMKPEAVRSLLERQVAPLLCATISELTGKP